MINTYLWNKKYCFDLCVFTIDKVKGMEVKDEKFNFGKWQNE